MLKKFLSITALLLVLVFAIASCGDENVQEGAENTGGATKATESSGLEFELNDDGASYKVTGIGTCTDTDLVIPAKHDGKPVTSIYFTAFDGCSGIKTVVVPEGVTSIYCEAFANCTSLTQITLPDSLTSLYNDVFPGCSSLKTITIPKGLTYLTISAFANCTGLETVIIPDNIESIKWGAFKGCTNLTKVIIPDTVTSIDENAFDGCENLTIYCEAQSMPEGWNANWNPLSRPVIWGYSEN